MDNFISMCEISLPENERKHNQSLLRNIGAYKSMLNVLELPHMNVINSN